MGMTRKDFELLAEFAVAELEAQQARELSKLLVKHYPNFNESKWCEAADVTFHIIRTYDSDRPSERIESGMTLKEAQTHCRRVDTHGEGWFDGYDYEG